MAKRSKKSEDTVKKIHRLLSILRKLDVRERCTPESLAQQFGTTIRNIHRDMAALNASGFSITFDKNAGTYRFTDPDFTLRDLNLNDDELMTLLVGKQVAHLLGKPFAHTYETLLKKVHKETTSETQAKLKRLEKGEYFLADIVPVEDFEKIERQYNAIEEAMNRKEKIWIVYKAMKDEEESTRCIEPYGLFTCEGMWYVIGFCHLRREIRTFALDCIRYFKITNKPYTIPADFNIADYFKSGWHMIRYGEPVEVVLKFSERYARWISRRKWHPTQVIEEQEDGSILFKVTVEGTIELKRWIYHWIPYCKILYPPGLREKVIGEMKAMLREYGIGADISQDT